MKKNLEEIIQTTNKPETIQHTERAVATFETCYEKGILPKQNLDQTSNHHATVSYREVSRLLKELDEIAGKTEKRSK